MCSATTSTGPCSALPQGLIHLQLNAYDAYHETPGDFDRHAGLSLPERKFEAVPVIRAYGSLPSGHNVLCHIHGVFPYIFVPYDGRDHDSLGVMQSRCASLHLKLERTLKEAYSRKKDDEDDTKGTENTGTSKNDADSLKFIADVSPVKGVDFYGYHYGYSAFYKISLLTQSATNKISDLLRDGKATGRKCKVFEAHIPYLLQFSTDYNLFGCSWLRLHQCYFRTPVLNPDFAQDSLLMNKDLEDFLARFYQGPTNESGEKLSRVGNSLIEIDVVPQFIQNREDITYRDLHNSLFEKSQDQSEETLFIPSTKELWTQTSDLRKEFGLETFEFAVEGKRPDKLPQWQSHEENMLFFQKAKERMSFRNGSKQNYSKNKYADQLELPQTALTFLWPTLNSTESPNSNVSSAIVSNSFNFPSSPISSQTSGEASEVESDANSVGGDFILPEAVGSKAASTAEELHSDNLNDISPSFNDHILTQRMVQKRGSKGVALSLKRPLKISKRINYDRSIPLTAESFKYKDFHLDFTNILTTIENSGFPKIDYMDPYFNDPEDLKKKEHIYSGQKYKIQSTHLTCRRPTDFAGETIRLESEYSSEPCESSWKYLVEPPTYSSVQAYSDSRKRKFRSQIDFKTLSNEFGYKFRSNNSLKGMSTGGHNQLSHLTLEIFSTSKNMLLPDPATDAIQLIFWEIEPGSLPIDFGISNEGIMAFSADDGGAFASRLESAANPTPVAIYKSEEEMISGLVDLILLIDPDILSAFEVHSSAWGYIIERCDLEYGRDFCEEISRVKYKPFNKRKDVWGFSHDSGIHIAGRHVLNLWRLLRSGLNLLKYTLENIAFHVLHERLAHFPAFQLTKLWDANADITALTTLLSYWKKRTEINIRLLQSQQTINQTVEQARLIGIDFYSVISRGSQYKVESVLVRLCKSEGFLVLSPSKIQVRKQKALECIPLVMEPESAFYKSPLVVLDFQSLYPSIMIGYNYCYSTILGRVQELKVKGTEVGATKINISKGFLKDLEDDITISPNGVLYVKEHVRKSMLAKMLADILHTRFLVKKTMSDLKSRNETISKLLNNKQIALKLLANVTYGYTSASFSGRMPCSDVADSIVQTGRETLQKAISLIEDNAEWGAKVVYGDTDSLFVYLPGKSREEAFRYGKEMAIEVTACNPFPVTLKFEKVYHPCVLVSKKRYVGYSFEKDDQKEPKFDAKGIETVRRDGHPAQQKIVEKSLRILFETQNISAVKAYVQDQFQKITRGQVSVQDFCFAREVKLGSYKSDKTAPPGAVVATKKIAMDHRAEPQYRERVSYVVIKGRPGQILRERCIPPEVFLSNESFELDSTYYITKTLIPPLQRFFNLMGVDVTRWYVEMPRFQDMTYNQAKEGKLPEFMRSTLCFNCKKEIKKRTNNILCAECMLQKSATVTSLLQEDRAVKRQLGSILTVCRSCCAPLTKNLQDDMSKIVTKCDSQDCPVYYSRIKYKGYSNTARAQQLLRLLSELDSW
ncbi:LAME_0H02234g1_1 [Lachancea meyersii CBS 8951]|uniref:DNA polymerase n=1 Tax=Lachancea meyersii CBS 8951 TaxID=1266667 RepID=A0A1G4KDF9_9SACH|nr:LAME_0H02234g1_1 [Lachancea meyersii CBS 8951]